MKRSDMVFWGVFAFGAAAFFLAGRAPATSAAEFEGEPEIVAATFSSAWCSSCKIIKPRLAKAMPDFSGEPVKFVEYDFTFGEKAKAREAALADGLGPVFDDYAKATGFTLLYDPERQEIIDILTVNHSSAAMRAAIARALAVASTQ